MCGWRRDQPQIGVSLPCGNSVCAPLDSGAHDNMDQKQSKIAKITLPADVATANDGVRLLIGPPSDRMDYTLPAAAKMSQTPGLSAEEYIEMGRRSRLRQEAHHAKQEQGDSEKQNGEESEAMCFFFFVLCCCWPLGCFARCHDNWGKDNKASGWLSAAYAVGCVGCFLSVGWIMFRLLAMPP